MEERLFSINKRRLGLLKEAISDSRRLDVAAGPKVVPLPIGGN